MPRIRDNQDRAEYAIYLIYAVMAVTAISIVSDCMQILLLQDIANGVEVSESATDSNDMRVQFIAIVYLLAFIASMVTFIMWFRRAYYNLGQVVNRLENTDAWAAGCWFVPIANFWMPYKIMNEIYERTNQYLIHKEIFSTTKLSTPIIGWWWTCWILMNITGRISSRMVDSFDVDSLISSTVFSVISGALILPAGFLVVKIIQDYQAVAHYLDSDEVNVDITEHLVEMG